MTLRFPAAALLAVAALALAACGEEPSKQADSGRPSGDGTSIDLSGPQSKKAELEYARCMREHGVEMPDPGSSEGQVMIGGDPGSDEAKEFSAADKACAEYREKMKPPALSEEQQQEFRDAALAHARCMREQGIDFPDPTFSEDGGALVKVGEGDLDPTDPDFKEAEQACADELAVPGEQP